MMPHSQNTSPAPRIRRWRAQRPRRTRGSPADSWFSWANSERVADHRSPFHRTWNVKRSSPFGCPGQAAYGVTPKSVMHHCENQSRRTSMPSFSTLCPTSFAPGINYPRNLDFGDSCLSDIISPKITKYSVDSQRNYTRYRSGQTLIFRFT